MREEALQVLLEYKTTALNPTLKCFEIICSEIFLKIQTLNMNIKFFNFFWENKLKSH